MDILKLKCIKSTSWSRAPSPKADPSHYPLLTESTEMKDSFKQQIQKMRMSLSPQNKTVRKGLSPNLFAADFDNKQILEDRKCLFIFNNWLCTGGVSWVRRWTSAAVAETLRSDINGESLPLTSALKCQSRSFSPLPKCHTAICGLHDVSRRSSGPSHRSLGRWGRCPGSHPRPPKKIKGAVNGTIL